MNQTEIEQALATCEWQRDALRAALEFMLDRFEGREGNIFSQRLACSKARDALAAIDATPNQKAADDSHCKCNVPTPGILLNVGDGIWRCAACLQTHKDNEAFRAAE